jgi:hypothetical protein
MNQIFLAAAFLRLFLAPFFFHPDLKTIFYNSHFLSFGVWNIYDYLWQHPQEAHLGPFVYPPLTYFLFGLLYQIEKIFAGLGFEEWLAMGNEAVGVANLFRFLFLVKFPLFVFEFLTGFLLIRLIQGEKQKKIALILWFFNPVNIYAICLMGQFDIIPAFLSVLSVYLSLTGSWGWAAFALGVGGAFKTYPLLFLPFLAVASQKKWLEQFKIFLFGLFPYFLTILPFINSKPFWESVLVSGLSQRIFLLGLPIGFGEQIFLVLFGLVILFLGQRNNLIKSFLAVTLIVLGGSHFHPQWFIWALPFLVVSVTSSKNLFLPFILLISGWLGVTFLFEDKFLTWGLFTPLEPGILFLPSIRELLKGVIDASLVQSVFHTIFAASAIWIVYLEIFKNENERR